MTTGDGVKGTFLTGYQNEARQVISMQEAAIEKNRIYVDKQSGKDFDRPAYRKLMKKLKRGDVLFIKSIDRLGRELYGNSGSVAYHYPGKGSGYRCDGYAPVGYPEGS